MPRPIGGAFRRARAHGAALPTDRAPGLAVAHVIAPPAPRSSAVVDPRIGDHGPALLALEDGSVFPGVAFGAPARGRRRPRREHQPDRLPGGLHGPLVCRPDRGHDLSAHRQLRPAPRRGSVAPTLAASARRRQRHGGRARRRPPAGGAAARRRHPGHRRRRHPRARPAPAHPRQPARDRHGARARRTKKPLAWRPVRSRAGRTRTSSARSRRRPSPSTRPCPARRAVRGSGSWTSGSRRTSSGPCAIAGRASASSRTTPNPPTSSPRTSTASCCRQDPATPPGSSARWPSPQRSSTTGGRCSGSAWDTRSSARAAGADTRRLRFGHHGANHPVQDLELGLVQVTAQNHEVQVIGESLPGGVRLPGQPGQPQRSARSRACAIANCPSRPSSTTRRARPGRSTRWRCSTGSWRRPAGAG